MQKYSSQLESVHHWLACRHHGHLWDPGESFPPFLKVWREPRCNHIKLSDISLNISATTNACMHQSIDSQRKGFSVDWLKGILKMSDGWMVGSDWGGVSGGGGGGGWEWVSTLPSSHPPPPTFPSAEAPTRCATGIPLASKFPLLFFVRCFSI